jgi:hypothetical protein
MAVWITRIEANFLSSARLDILPTTTWALVDPKMLAARAGSTIAGFRAYVALSITVKQSSD